LLYKKNIIKSRPSRGLTFYVDLVKSGQGFSYTQPKLRGSSDMSNSREENSNDKIYLWKAKLEWNGTTLLFYVLS
jgi:hypothetical protein